MIVSPRVPMHQTVFIGRRYLSCWDFVVDYYREQEFEVKGTAFESTGLFTEAQTPTDDDLCMIEQNGQQAAHCGIYCRGGVLHHTIERGVIFQPVETFKHVGYYRPCRLH